MHIILFGKDIEMKKEICFTLDFMKNIATEASEEKFPGSKDQQQKIEEQEGKKNKKG